MVFAMGSATCRESGFAVRNQGLRGGGERQQQAEEKQERAASSPQLAFDRSRSKCHVRQDLCFPSRFIENRVAAALRAGDARTRVSREIDLFVPSPRGDVSPKPVDTELVSKKIQ